MLVEQATKRLWSPAGLRYRRWLHLRGLTNATIRAAGIGWTPGVTVPIRGEVRCFRAIGFVIPWFDSDRLAMVKVRQPSARKPNYVEAFRDGPSVYPSLSVVRPGRPLIVVEREIDALLLGQLLADVAVVVAVGSPSSPLGERVPRDPVSLRADLRRPRCGPCRDRRACLGHRGRSASGLRPRTRTGPQPPDPGWICDDGGATGSMGSTRPIASIRIDRIAGSPTRQRVNGLPGMHSLVRRARMRALAGLRIKSMQSKREAL